MVKPYAAKTGTNVVEDEYDQKLAEIRAQVEANSLKWDVIMVGPSVGPLACDEGLLEDVSGKGVMDQADFSKPLIPCLVPMFSSSGVLVYDGAKLGDNGPKTWADFWDVKKFPGKRGFYNAPNETLELALARRRRSRFRTDKSSDLAGRRRPRVQEARRAEAATSNGGTAPARRCSSWRQGISP